MKKKMPRLLIYLLGIVVSFIAAMPGTIILQKNEDSFIGLVLLMIPLFAFYGFAIAFIVRLLRIIVKKVSMDHKEPETVTVQTTKEVHGRTVVTGVHTYNKNETFRYQGAQASLSWGMIAVFLVVLFPLGIYFAIIKVSEEKDGYFQNGVRMQVLGGFTFLIFGGFVLMIAKTGYDSMEAFISVCMLPATIAFGGLITLLAGSIIRHKGKIYDQYMTLITNRNVTRISQIASDMHTSYSKASETIQDLIDSGILEGAYIYHEDGEVIIPGISKKIAVKCHSCGSTSVLYTTDEKKCAWCGAEL